MKCTFCHGPVEEDVGHVNAYSNGSSLGKFNDQMESIFKLLKECENINLAPEVLEPTPSTAEIRSSSNRSHSSSSKSGWARGKTADLYDQTFQINVGDEVKQETKVAKEMPVWMSQSTVFNEESNDSTSSSFETKTSLTANTEEPAKENEIMTDLLAYETTTKKTRYETHKEKTIKSEESVFNELSDITPEPSSTTVEAEVMESEEEEEDERRVKVGDTWYALEDVNEEVTARMTESEHETYLKLYNDAYNEYY